MLSVEVFCDSQENCNTYLITQDQYAIVIDPANNVKTLKQFLENKILCAVFLTHGHYDHFKELEDVLKTYDVKCYLHKKAKDKIFDLDTSYAKYFGCDKLPYIEDNKFVFLKDNEKLQFANFYVQILFTPGHTDDSVCYIIDNLLFSGDTLFKGSVGRTDLATGNIIAQIESLKKIKNLKQNYFIYPGHNEFTTLDYEIKNNYYLKK